jgi:hypothetical protein
MHRLLLLVAFLFGQSAMSAETLSPIKVGGEGGFVDIEAAFTRTRSIEGEGGIRGTAIEFGGTFDGKAAKYILLVPRDWDDAPLAGLRLKPVPKSSDLGFRAADEGSVAFLAMLAKLYQLPTKTRRPNEFVAVQAIALGGVPEPLESGSIESKVFFRGPGLYAELYVHVDFSKRVLRLNEKDPEYRAAILNALSE